MSADDEAGMAWWNSLTKQERAKWSAIAGNTGRAVDAWQVFKQAAIMTLMNAAAAGSAGAPRGLTPQDVVADLLGSGDFPAEVMDPEGAARIILDRLRAAGFDVVDAS
jgi:hypothetical protein